MAKRIGICVLILALMAAPATAFAQSSWTNEAGYANQVKGKFVFGLKNALLGWTEFFTQPYDEFKDGGNIAVGIAKGLWNGVGQTVGGALHLATFPITQLDVPLPEGGTQLL